MRSLAAAEDPNSAGPPPTLLRCKRYCTRHARLCTGKDVCYGPRDTGRCMRNCMALDGGGRAGGIAGGARNSGPGAGNLHCMSFFLDVVERSRVQEGVCDYACDGGGMCDASVAHECGAYCDQMAAGPGNHDCCPDGADCASAAGAPPYFYTARGECMAACRAFRRGSLDTFADTLECRLLFLNIGEQGFHGRFHDGSPAAAAAAAAAAGGNAEGGGGGGGGGDGGGRVSPLAIGHKAFACPHAGRRATVSGAAAAEGVAADPMCSDAFQRSGQATQCARYCDWYGMVCADRPPPFGAPTATAAATAATAATAAAAAAACQAGCMALRADGVPGALHGNTLQCRLKAVAVAARSTVPDIHCSHDLICVDGLAEPRPPPDELEQLSGGLRGRAVDQLGGLGQRILARELANVQRHASGKKRGEL